MAMIFMFVKPIFVHRHFSRGGFSFVCYVKTPVRIGATAIERQAKNQMNAADDFGGREGVLERIGYFQMCF